MKELKKKELNKRNLFIKKWTFKILSFVGLFLPMVLLVLIRRKTYITENPHAWSIGVGGIAIVFFTILLCKVGFKKLHPVAWAIFIVLIIQCFYSIIQDIRPISYVFATGVALYSIFEIPMKYYTRLYGIWTDEEVRMVVRKEHKKENNEEEDYGGRA